MHASARVREEMEGRGLSEKETLFLRGAQLWLCRVPSLRVKAVVREKTCVPSVFKINSFQSPFRHGISRGVHSAPSKNLRATRNWEGVMKLSVVAYYKFSELPPGLTFARHWNVSQYGLGDAFGARGVGGSQLGRKSGTPPPTTWEGLKLQLPQYIRPSDLSSKGFLGAEHHGNCSPILA